MSVEFVVDVEKPTAGGRMLARHEGQVVLLWGAIPGERVRARVERLAKGVVFADTVEVITPSAHRRDAGPDWRCGGGVFAHVAYERQLRLKGEIVQDALGRIARMPQPEPPPVAGSPEQGYRMRARLHARGERLGFYREGTHHLCSAAATGQLLPATNAWIAAAERILTRDRLDGLAGIEIAENIPADQRSCHLELHAGADAPRFATLAETGVTGLSAGRADRPGIETLAGSPWVIDVLDAGAPLRVRRDVRAFFQGNRFLLEGLVRHVVALVPAGPVVDLYAGVGLFGLALAAANVNDVTLVEGDPVSGADLQHNAGPFGDRVRVERRSVEAFLAARPGGGHRPGAGVSVIVDPPRTGVSPEALGGIVRIAPSRIVYVSCDVATFARDARRLVDAGHEMEALTALDLFPNTAHVETVGLFMR